MAAAARASLAASTACLHSRTRSRERRRRLVGQPVIVLDDVDAGAARKVAASQASLRRGSPCGLSAAQATAGPCTPVRSANAVDPEAGPPNAVQMPTEIARRRARRRPAATSFRTACSDELPGLESRGLHRQSKGDVERSVSERRDAPRHVRRLRSRHADRGRPRAAPRRFARARSPAPAPRSPLLAHARDTTRLSSARHRWRQAGREQARP